MDETVTVVADPQTESIAVEPPKAGRKKGWSWTPEQRAKMKATIAARKAAKETASTTTKGKYKHRTQLVEPGSPMALVTFTLSLTDITEKLIDFVATDAANKIPVGEAVALVAASTAVLNRAQFGR